VVLRRRRRGVPRRRGRPSLRSASGRAGPSRLRLQGRLDPGIRAVGGGAGRQRAVVISNAGIDLPEGAVGSLYTFAVTFFAISVLSALDPRSADDVGRADSVFNSLKDAFPSRGEQR